MDWTRIATAEPGLAGPGCRHRGRNGARQRGSGPCTAALFSTVGAFCSGQPGCLCISQAAPWSGETGKIALTASMQRTKRGDAKGPGRGGQDMTRNTTNILHGMPTSGTKHRDQHQTRMHQRWGLRKHYDALRGGSGKRRGGRRRLPSVLRRTVHFISKQISNGLVYSLGHCCHHRAEGDYFLLFKQLYFLVKNGFFLLLSFFFNCTTISFLFSKKASLFST